LRPSFFDQKAFGFERGRHAFRGFKSDPRNNVGKTADFRSPSPSWILFPWAGVQGELLGRNEKTAPKGDFQLLLSKFYFLV
jgi:hypothetical protein